MDKVQYWLDIADYDYDTATDLMKSKRWVYVAFMCHQTLEKTIKAYFTKHVSDTPPYLHNLTRLAEQSGLYEIMSEEQKSFLDAMTPMNIEARYPNYKSMLASSLNEEVCQHLMEQTQTMRQWIKDKL